jgi:tRNA isopentenyl-2-thiomethyl-A-37 hydroxylase MiaE
MFQQKRSISRNQRKMLMKETQLLRGVNIVFKSETLKKRHQQVSPSRYADEVKDKTRQDLMCHITDTLVLGKYDGPTRLRHVYFALPI